MITYASSSVHEVKLQVPAYKCKQDKWRARQKVKGSGLETGFLHYAAGGC